MNHGQQAKTSNVNTSNVKTSYEDILHCPHHVSRTHLPMSMAARAAQFAPFAALTGFDAKVKETGRRTDRRIELDETQKNHLDQKLQDLQRRLAVPVQSKEELPEVDVCYFVKDAKKEGGQYVTKRVHIYKTDTLNGCLITATKDRIPVEDILDFNESTYG